MVFLCPRDWLWPFAHPVGVNRQLTALTLVFASCWLSLSQPLSAQPGGMPPSPVEVARAQALTEAASKAFVGSLVPIRKSTVGSAVDGRVVEIFVDEGDPVNVGPAGSENENGEILGQPMIQLRTVALDIEIEAAKVELESRKMAASELRQLLPAEIESAEAAVEEIKARLQYSQENYERLQGLAEDNGVARRELDEAYSLFRSQSQLLIGSQALFNRLKATRDEKLSQATLRVDAQRAEIRRLEEQRFEYTIRAPFAGFVTAKNTELGQWVKRGDEVMEVIQLDPIELVVPVPESYIQKLQISMDRARAQKKNVPAVITLQSVTELIEGEVVQIVPEANLLSRSFPVKIRINNPSIGNGHLLKSGMMATARMFVGPAEPMLFVPKDALVLGGPQVIVYVVRKDPVDQDDVAIPVPVQIGASINRWIQVSGQLEADDRVVILGNERLRPNQKVQIIKERDDTIEMDSVPAGG